MRADALALALASLLCAACAGDECAPGQQQPCTRAVEGGYTQRGYQACGARATWSACVPTGQCVAAGGRPLPAYGRCETAASCGPAGCAVCGHYVGVKNPQGYGLCYVYCQGDAECAPDSASDGVTARCVLGQCTLLCREGAACPRDTQCLAWGSPSLAAANPGYAGLCQ